MTTILWNTETKRFCIQFGANDDRDALRAAIKATPEASIFRFEAQDVVPVEPSTENIVALWVSGYNWQDDAAQEALQRIVPVVQKHLFQQSK
jgi:hypothetical protein